MEGSPVVDSEGKLVGVTLGRGGQPNKMITQLVSASDILSVVSEASNATA